LALFTLLVLVSVNANGQLTTADVLGTVTDATGAVVPNAKVTIKNLGTGVTATASSNGKGDYIFNLLTPGHYSIAIEASGFKSVVYEDVALAAGDRVRENGNLEAGAITETVEVTSVEPLLQTDSSAVTSVVTEQSVQDLPLNGRNFVNLVQIQPGVTPGQPGAISSGNRPDDRRETSTVSANGQSDLYNNQMIEGMDNNERQQGFLGVRPSIDAIAEVKVDTNAYGAEVGRNAGAVVNIITKSGTSQYHGTAYEFFRNDIFDSREFFTKAPTATTPGIAKPEYRQNQFGGSLGGPVVKNRTFFFGDAEDNRNIQGMPSGALTVPSLQERGDINTSGNYDFTDNGGTLIPGFLASALTNPVGLAYLKMYPKPNTGAAGATIQNYIAAPKKPQHALSLDGRIDQNFKNGDLLFGRYSYNNVNTFVPGAFPAVSEAEMTIQPGGNGGAFPGASISKAHGVQFNYVHMIAPRLIMELKTGYTRIDIDTTALNSGHDVSSAIGLVNVNTPAAPETSGLMPVDFLTGGYAAPGDTIFLPILDKNNTFQYLGSLTYTQGAHNIKGGAQFTRRQLNYFQSPEPLGLTFFAGLTGNAMEDLLMGLPIGYMRGNTLTQPGYRASEYAGYVQDDWRVNQSLTLNIGVRYDVYEALSEAHGKYSNFLYDPATYTGTLITGSQNPHIGVSTDHKNFAPRVGFSQSISKRTVVRGGYGISYYPTAIQSAIQNPNPPYEYANTCIPCFTFHWPTLPLPTPSSTTNLSGSLSYLPKNLNTSSVQEFNLMVQQEFGANVLTVGGVGELGRRVSFQTYINFPDPNGPYPNNATQGPAAAPAMLTAKTLPNVGEIYSFAPWGTTNYYAMQTVFARRFTRGLAFNANYTWAHGLSDAYSGSAAVGATGLIPSNPHYDYGNSEVDVRHRFAANWNYQLPFGEHASGAKALLMKGWESNFVIFWQSGQSFGVGDSFTNANGLAQINLPNVTTDRPDVVSGQPFRTSSGSISNWLNPAAFTPQAAGTAGDERNEAFYGPHTRRADMSLFKNFRLTEKVSTQFRVECYNISNTPNFSVPNSTITAWTAGPGHDSTHPISNPAKNPALTAVGLLPGDIPTSAGGFGTISSTVSGVNPRQFQFALKLLF
jgi:hypothetical protein